MIRKLFKCFKSSWAGVVAQGQVLGLVDRLKARVLGWFRLVRDNCLPKEAARQSRQTSKPDEPNS